MIRQMSAGRGKHAICEKLARKKGYARDNAKINYTCFAIQLFSHMIILSPIARENFPLSRA